MSAWHYYMLENTINIARFSLKKAKGHICPLDTQGVKLEFELGTDQVQCQVQVQLQWLQTSTLSGIVT